MKKTILALLLISVSLYAELKNEYITQQMLDSNMKIVDIRTAPEWKDTGLLKDVIPIVFFRQNGSYDINAFLNELNQKVDTTKQFALICHTGSRTSILATFLSEKLHYKVINIVGGMDYATKGLKMKTYPYK